MYMIRLFWLRSLAIVKKATNIAQFIALASYNVICNQFCRIETNIVIVLIQPTTCDDAIAWLIPSNLYLQITGAFC